MSDQSKLIIIGMICVTILLLARKADAESNSYIQVKLGTFTDACRALSCAEPDGKLPARLAIGHKWAWSHKHEVAIEWQHASNADLGWPFGSRYDKEYDRNGIFGSYTYNFNFRR